MPEFHSEPYLYLPAISHRSVLVAWGAFYFRARSENGMKLVEAKDLQHLHPPRVETIGARSSPYGEATVTVRDGSGRVTASGFANSANHCWISGLEPDTEYSYTVTVNGEEWAAGTRWDWSPGAQALVPGGRYDNRFRTHPDPATRAAGLTFAVIGDFGVGMRQLSERHRQKEVADALQVAVEQHGVRFVLTTGDNIYAGKKLLGLLPIGDTGAWDDDWFFTYFQPYRYILNRVCVYPSIGNHDTGESEDNDDRSQVEDNFYVRLRIGSEEASGRSSFEPGLFYRFKYGADIEFVCIDTSKEQLFDKRLFEHPKHRDFLTAAFAGTPAPAWLIPFCHHPPFCAGPRHHNTTDMHAELVPSFQRSGVKVVFSVHEHNFQHSLTGGIHYLVSGAAAKFRPARPNRFSEAHTQSWSPDCHFLLVEISGRRMSVRAIGELAPGRTFVDIARTDPSDSPVTGPIFIDI